jgi:type IV pilus assembly protein PilQ
VAAGTGLIGMRTVDPADNSSFGRTGLVFTTNPLSKQSDYMLQLRSLVSTNKAKILANPTVVAAHDTESIISIVDEIVRRVTTQIDPSGFSTQTVEIGEAGIVMDILPKIGEDGTISMRLRPSVTSVLQQTEDSAGNIITLLSKRDMLTQNVRVNDGQTLVIGGLIQERTSSRNDKMPIGSDLPIVGAMFRASQKNNKRSELVLLITPHIISNTKITPVNAISTTGNSSQTKLAGGQ